VAACSKLGIKAAHVPAYSPNAVSEFTVGLILTLTRRIHAAIKKAERKDFSLRGLIGTEDKELRTWCDRGRQNRL